MGMFTLSGNYFPVEEAAESLGRTVAGVHKLITNGHIEAVRVSPRCFLIPEKEIERIRMNPPKRGRPRS